MEMNGSVTNQTSTYGLACMPCFKAKCRCVPRPGRDSCERCFRLRKDCQPSDSARRRHTQKSHESDNRIAQLEGKIDTLLSVIQSAVSSSGTSLDLSPLLGKEGMPSFSTGTNTTSACSLSGNPDSRGVLTLPGGTTRSNSFSLSEQEFPPSKADERFNFFQLRMLPCFPFIRFLPGSTASHVRQERPFLFHAITTVTSFSIKEKLVRAEEFRRLVFQSALLDAKSNVDLLVGILTYVTWSTDAFLGRAELLSRLMMLAISLVYDLRLFKPPSPDMQLIVAITQGYSDDVHDHRNESIQDFMDKQRIVLACFVLSANISSHFGRIDALRWTSQMEETLRIIESNKQYPADEIFASQVRLQLLTQRVAHLREQHETDRARTSTNTANVPAPAFLYLKSLRNQLQEYKDSLSPELRQQDFFSAYTQYAELYINQVALSVGSDAPLLSTSWQSMDHRLLPGLGRVECLWQCVEAIKAWLDSFHKMQPAECVGLPFHFWSQAIRCITILKFLSVYQDPAWDCQAVRNTVDLLDVLDWIPKKLDLASKEVGIQTDDDILKLFSKLLSRSREWAEARFNMSSSSSSLYQTHECPYSSAAIADVSDGTTEINDAMLDMDQMDWFQAMDLESDKWFEEVLGWPPAAP